MADFSTWVESNKKRFVEELCELLRIPSVSTKKDRASDVKRCAELVADNMRKVGLKNVVVEETPGHPIVYGEWLEAKGQPTILIYGHYDVQPEEPLDEWKTPPFEPTIKGDTIYGRGTTDDKGQLFVHIKSVEAHMQANGKLPINVKFLIEGEEEVGGPSLEQFVKDNKDRLACDSVLISDTPMVGYMEPSITSSLRGLCYTQIDVQGFSKDLHSGHYGGAVVNPANALAEIISKLKNDKNEVTVPGFYEDVREFSDEQRKMIRSQPFNEKDYKNEIGAIELDGEEGYHPLERSSIRPTLDVNGLLSGYTQEGAKTIIPAKAMAKVSMRLVPDQDAAKVFKKFKSYVESIAPKGVKVTVTDLHGGNPYMTSIDSPFMKAASAAYGRAFGKEAIFTADGGSIPVTRLLQDVLGVETVLMGVGMPDDGLHSPNEKFNLEHFYHGILASAYYFDEIASR